MEAVRLQILHASSSIAILFVIHFRGWSIFLTNSHYRVLPRMSSFLFFHNSPKHLLKFWQCLIVPQLNVACVYCMDCFLIPCFMVCWLPFVITQSTLPLAGNECESVGLQCMYKLKFIGNIISLSYAIYAYLVQWINLLLTSQEGKNFFFQNVHSLSKAYEFLIPSRMSPFFVQSLAFKKSIIEAQLFLFTFPAQKMTCFNPKDENSRKCFKDSKFPFPFFL